MRLACFASILFLIACTNDALPTADGPPAVDAAADLARDAAVDLAFTCPAQEPPTNCFVGGAECGAPGATCHYGGDTCLCQPSGVPGKGNWFCNPDACATAGPFHGACGSTAPTCCVPEGLCTCTTVCTSRVWVCRSEAGNDMTMVPGYDMCP